MTKVIKIVPGKLTGKQAVSLVEKALKALPLHYTDVGISRMNMSQWRNAQSKPDIGSCLKIADLLTCNGLPADVILPKRKGGRFQ